MHIEQLLVFGVSVWAPLFLVPIIGMAAIWLVTFLGMINTPLSLFVTWGVLKDSLWGPKSWINSGKC